MSNVLVTFAMYSLEKKYLGAHFLLELDRTGHYGGHDFLFFFLILSNVPIVHLIKHAIDGLRT